SGTVEEVTKRGGLLRVRLAAPVALDAAREAAREVVREVLEGRDPRVESDVLVIELREGEDPTAVNAAVLPALIARGVRVLEVQLGQSLENAYMASRDPR